MREFVAGADRGVRPASSSRDRRLLLPDQGTRTRLVALQSHSADTRWPAQTDAPSGPAQGAPRRGRGGDQLEKSPVFCVSNTRSSGM